MDIVIREIVSHVIENTDFKIVDVVVRHSVDHDFIQIFVDSETGINIGECQSIARSLNERLENDPRFQKPYSLEVSSPGIDRPISKDWQFRKNTGRIILVQFANDAGELEIVKGRVEKVEAQTVVVAVRSKKQLDLISIPIANIRNAKVQLNLNTKNRK